MKYDYAKSSSHIKLKFRARLLYPVGPLEKDTVVNVEYSDLGIQRRYVIKKKTNDLDVSIALMYDRGEVFDHEILPPKKSRD
jgi:hypothetical protein